mmetsp:Transcript_11437/g.47911  ORF Transcript_11437/g.47911 Transcript_11437/m.47911 type:complete len:235 (+) Transcript_11437:2073-2777(+)
MFIFGKADCKSEANCSPSQRETSQPVTMISTELCSTAPSCRFRNRLFNSFTKCHAVKRFKEMVPLGLLCQSSFMAFITLGISDRSNATGSFEVGGRGSTNSLSSSFTHRLIRGALLCACDSSCTMTVTFPFIISCRRRCSRGADISTLSFPPSPQSSRTISPPRSSKSSRIASFFSASTLPSNSTRLFVSICRTGNFREPPCEAWRATPWSLPSSEEVDPEPSTRYFNPPRWRV